MDIDPDRVIRSPFAAGALGSLVALRFAPGASWAERAFNVVTGSLCAGFLGPAVADWLHVTSPNMTAGMNFGVGMFGLSLAAAITQGIKDTKFAEILGGWLRKGG